MNRYISAFAALIMSSSIYAGEASEVVDQIKDSAINQAFSYGDSAVESWARDNLTSLRLIEIETRAREDSKPTFRAITLFELTGNEYNKILSQISYSTFNDRETLNCWFLSNTFKIGSETSMASVTPKSRPKPDPRVPISEPL